EWSKEKDQDLKESSGYDSGTGGITIPLGMEFEDPDVMDLARRMQQMTAAAQHEQPQSREQQKLNQTLIREAQQEAENFIDSIILPEMKKNKRKKKETPKLNFENKPGESSNKSPTKMGTFFKAKLSQLDKILQQEADMSDPKIRKGIQ
ncbi:10522_t:CDS:1, partial [Ambispora leptoticha]